MIGVRNADFTYFYWYFTFAPESEFVSFGI